MLKKLTTTLCLALGTLSGMAQTIMDPTDPVYTNPWGFATISDEAGTAYKMDGGMRAEKPKTIVLTAVSGDNASAITSAIRNYDIIVLDGSKGTFTISAQMKLNSLQNKTIVGRNNAKLATEFYLTQDDIAYLKSKNLEGMSSTNQYTGTLPGETESITCDERAFFTKKAMMELAYQKGKGYTLPNKAGIFEIDHCENIIVRNLILEGPGAVDIDGVDLIYNAYSTHLWIDHCTFIDSQDGALDTRGDYCTYTWNKFYYTDRSYSHAYTCGLGWVKEHSTVLHVTWGCNEWGEGCMRRLPQGDDCYLHLVNNYHNCPGNSVGMTLNNYAKALVENNYAAKGVNKPLDINGTDRCYVYAEKNSFTASPTTTKFAVPYTYNKFSYSYVPSIVGGPNGAGANLTEFMPGEKKTLNAESFGFYDSEMEVITGISSALPLKNLIGATYTLTSDNPAVASVEGNSVKGVAEGETTITANVNDSYYGTFTATINIKVAKSSGGGGTNTGDDDTPGGGGNTGDVVMEYQTLKKWNFKKRSSATNSDLAADANWTGTGTYIYSPAINSPVELTANGNVIAETEGLKFVGQAESIQYYSNSIRLQKTTDKVTVPSLQKNDKLIITWKSANSTAYRGFNCTNLSESEFTTNGTEATKTLLVLADGDVVMTPTDGGVYLYSIEVQREQPTGVANAPVVVKPLCNRIYNLNGQRVGKNAKGIIIENGVKKVRK